MVNTSAVVSVMLLFRLWNRLIIYSTARNGAIALRFKERLLRLSLMDRVECPITDLSRKDLLCTRPNIMKETPSEEMNNWCMMKSLVTSPSDGFMIRKD